MFGKMNITQKTYVDENPVAKQGEFFLKETGAKIPAQSLCGIKYSDGKIYPYSAGATDGTEIPRYYSEEEVEMNSKSRFMRNGTFWEDRLKVTSEAREKMMDIGFRFIKANKQY